MNTLLVIDMQNGWIAEHPRFDIEAVLARIEQTAAHFRANGQKVIFVRHQDNETAVNTPAWQIHPSLSIDASDSFVDKTACDSFSGTDLLTQLQKLGTTTVTICGLATEFCVDTTVRAALSNGLNVIVLADAHTTANRAHLTAQAIIEHHNWVWQNLAAPAGCAISVSRAALYPEQ